MQSKSTLRRLLKERRAHFTNEYVRSVSERASRNCQDFFDWSSASVVHIYLPIEKRNEIDTWPLIYSLLRHFPHLKIVTPYMAGSTLQSVYIDATTTYIKGRFGIPQPSQPIILPTLDAIDTIIVPVLGFDGRGYRVGYGSGYYDRLLSECRPERVIGFAFSETFIPAGIPVEAHDQVLDCVVTENYLLTDTDKPLLGAIY